jgi:hypothetical protein
MPCQQPDNLPLAVTDFNLGVDNFLLNFGTLDGKHAIEQSQEHYASITPPSVQLDQPR